MTRVVLATALPRSLTAGVAGAHASLAAAMRRRGVEVEEIYGDSLGRYRATLQWTHVVFPLLLRARFLREQETIFDVHSGDGWLLPGDRLSLRSHGLEHAYFPVRQVNDFMSLRFRTFLTLYRLPTVRRAYRKAAVAISPSCSDMADFARYGVKVGGRHVVIPHGLDQLWQDGQRSPTLPGRLRMLFIGNWSPIKGGDRIPHLLRSLSSLGQHLDITIVSPDADVVMAGDLGPGVAIRRLTHADRAEIHALMLAHDLLLVPSRYEPFGRVTLEGMGVGMVVAASPLGAALDMIADGENGLLMDFDNALGSAERIMALAGGFASIGAHARDSVTYLTWDYVAERTLVAYPSGSR